LADYLPYLYLLWELLREHADQILPHPSEGPITISVKPGDLVLLEDLPTLSIGTLVDQTSSSHPHNTHHCQAQWDPPVAASLKDKTLSTNFRLFHYNKGCILLCTTEPHETMPLLRILSLFHSYISS
jgi:hypothetical protein